MEGPKIRHSYKEAKSPPFVDSHAEYMFRMWIHLQRRLFDNDEPIDRLSSQGHTKLFEKAFSKSRKFWEKFDAWLNEMELQ